MKIKFAIPILAAVLLCSALLLTASPAQAAVSSQAGNEVQPLSPADLPPPPPPPPPAPPPAPPTPPAYHPPAPLYHPPAPSYHPPRPPAPIYPSYSWNNWSWPWVGTYRWYVRPATPVIVTPAYTYQYPYSYAPVVNSFTANPSYIQPGESAILSWTVTNATNVLISPSVGSVANSGAFTVQPAYTTTYTLTATGSNGTVSASTTVTVAQVVTAYSTTTTVSPPTTTSNQDSGFFNFFTGGLSSGSSSATNLWLMYTLLIGLLGVAAAVIIFLITRKPAAAHAGANAGYAASSTAVSSGTGMMHTTPVAAGHGARLVTSSGEQIDLGGRLGALGRNDFQSLLKPDRAGLVSRQHILLDYDSGRYYIEDKHSTNGTRLNGSAIKGTGRHMLKEGDTIELGNALTFTFRT